MSNEYEEVALRPLTQTSKFFNYMAIALLAVVGWFAFAWWTQLRTGLVVTGLRDLGVPMAGSPWGVYIGNFVWFVGIAHGGIAVSAAIRLLKLERFRAIGRMAELLTIVTLTMAGFNIVVDLGRPDRVFNMIFYYGERATISPLTWDLTVILIYFALSACYLYLTMREDLASLRPRFPRLEWLYRPLLVGYTPGEKPKVDRIAWWLALSLMVLMVLLSGGVIPWLFGLQGAQAGWFGAAQGPYFLTAALTSAIAAVILVAAALRKAFSWKEQVKPEIFRGLGIVLGIFIALYLWFILHEHLTMRYAGTEAEFRISEALLSGQFAPMYWTMLVTGFFIPLAYLFVQAVNGKAFRLWGIVASSILVIVALWVKRFVIVVPSLLYPLLPYPHGSYTPTWVEWSIVAGTIAIACLLYMGFMKFFPIMELRRDTDG